MIRSACLAIALALAAGAALAAPSGPQGDTAASVAKLPNWSGVWAHSDQGFQQSLGAAMGRGAAAPKFKPDYMARSRSGGPASATNNAGACNSIGMPGIMGLPHGFEFLFTPGRVTILGEEGPMLRRVFTDGRKHAPDADPTIMGESIGHWEGDTLVVDTVAISKRGGFVLSLKTSGKAHVVERFRLADKNTMTVETTVEDSDALDAPWRYTRTYTRSATDLMPQYCDPTADRDSGGEPDLTPPTP